MWQGHIHLRWVNSIGLPQVYRIANQLKRCKSVIIGQPSRINTTANIYTLVNTVTPVNVHTSLSVPNQQIPPLYIHLRRVNSIGLPQVLLANQLKRCKNAIIGQPSRLNTTANVYTLVNMATPVNVHTSFFVSNQRILPLQQENRNVAFFQSIQNSICAHIPELYSTK